MQLLVIVALVFAWAGVAYYFFAGNRAERRPVDSIGDFRRQMHVMSRSTEPLMAPANTLRDVQRGGMPSGYSGPATGSARHPRGAGGVARPHALPGYGARVAPSAAYRISPRAAARRQTQRRRRDVLFGLVGAAALTLVLGLMPGLGVLIVVHLAFDLTLVAYMALLVRMRNLEAERGMKVHFLSPARPAFRYGIEPALVLSRSGS